MTKGPRHDPSYALAEILDSNAAAELASDLLARRGAPLTLDASRVQKLGGLCLQVLLAARASWALDKIPFALSIPSAAFRESLTQFGADPLLT